MKFGLFYLPTYLPAIRDVQAHYRGIIEQVEFAERIGIDYVWLVEHHFVRHGGLFPANYAFLSYLAARTKRIRLGTGATVLPLNDPCGWRSRPPLWTSCRKAGSISASAAASFVTNSTPSASR